MWGKGGYQQDQQAVHEDEPVYIFSQVIKSRCIKHTFLCSMSCSSELPSDIKFFNNCIIYYINNPYNSVLREKAMNSFMQTIRKVFYQYSLHGDVSRPSVLKNLTVEKVVSPFYQRPQTRGRSSSWGDIQKTKTSRVSADVRLWFHTRHCRFCL